MKQADLARALDVSIQTINGLANGKAGISAGMIARIAKELGVDESILVSDVESGWTEKKTTVLLTPGPDGLIKRADEISEAAGAAIAALQARNDRLQAELDALRKEIADERAPKVRPGRNLVERHDKGFTWKLDLDDLLREAIEKQTPKKKNGLSVVPDNPIFPSEIFDILAPYANDPDSMKDVIDCLRAWTKTHPKKPTK